MADLTIPDGVIISDVSISSEHRTYITESINGKFDARDSGIQRFSGTITLTAGNGLVQQKALNSFLMGLKGRLNTIKLLLDGEHSLYTTQVDANPTLAASTVVGSDIVAASTTYDIPQGSIFTFANEDKVYTLLEDLNAGATNYSVSVTPKVKEVHLIGEQLNFRTPTFTVILVDNTTTTQHNESGLITSATLDFVERY